MAFSGIIRYHSFGYTDGYRKHSAGNNIDVNQGSQTFSTSMLPSTAVITPTVMTGTYRGETRSFSGSIPSTASFRIEMATTDDYNGSAGMYFDNVIVRKYASPAPSTGNGAEEAGCIVAVPIELLRFTASLLPDRRVQCNWVTASERDNDYFTVEKNKRCYQLHECW